MQDVPELVLEYEARAKPATAESENMPTSSGPEAHDPDTTWCEAEQSSDPMEWPSDWAEQRPTTNKEQPTEDIVVHNTPKTPLEPTGWLFEKSQTWLKLIRRALQDDPIMRCVDNKSNTYWPDREPSRDYCFTRTPA